MTLEAFIKEYDDTYVEVGGSANARNQCVDLANAYIMQVLGKEPIFGTNAKDFWTVADDSYERIQDPQKGDIVIWSTGTVGHIAVFVEGTRDFFTSFDQNYPLGSPCHLQPHNNKNLIGFLRTKGDEMGFDDNQVRNLFTNGFRQMREKLLGQVIEEDLLKDVEFRLGQMKNGSVHCLAEQFSAYFDASTLVNDAIIKTRAEDQKVLERELDNVRLVEKNSCISKIEAKDKEITSLKADLEEMEGLLHSCSSMSETQKQFSLVEFIKDLLNIFRKDK